MKLLHIKPEDIEKRSFEIISSELNEMGISLLEDREMIVKRVIHTTADFDYAQNLVFSADAIDSAKKALLEGAVIVTDTMMAYSGINKNALKKLDCHIYNFIADEDVKSLAKCKGLTRSSICMDKAFSMAEKESRKLILAIGNAPTALLRIDELVKETGTVPALVIGVPVGFVNVVHAKETIIESGIPSIVARGRKGGSNVAASIVNAITYQLVER